MKNKSWTATHHLHSDHYWGIILAGGNGTRLQQFIKMRFGEHRPKQYCALTGTRSMLRHTIDRIDPIFSSDHLYTTVSAGHLRWAFDQLHDRQPKTVVIQPVNRETGPGILLPLLHVHHTDPEAVISLFPADHFILQEEQYRQYVREAMAFVTTHRDRIVILGVAPSTLQYGYGWIETNGDTFGKGIHGVKTFWEKPDPVLLRFLHEKKCLWNTMTIVGTSSMLQQLYEEHMAEVILPARRIVQAIGTTFESDVTEDVFRRLPSVNFSRRILEKIPAQLCVLPMDGVYWNDWGDEMRILNDLRDLEQHGDLISNGEIRLPLSSEH